MSAYIVEKATIDRIVTYLETNEVRREIEDYFRYPTLRGTCAEQGQRLWTLNVRAVDARYEETNPVELYRHESNHCSKTQTLKSLRCFLYQCSEGDIPETPLYKDLSALADRLTMSIVEDLPEYESAQWA